MTNCPTPESLHEFLNGESNAEVQVEIEEHLLNCTSCMQALDRAADDPSLIANLRAAVDFDTPAPSPRVGLGSNLEQGPTDAGYKILRRIGAGGMGLVFEAEQQRTQRKVALKVVQPGLATSATLRRFRLEAEVLGRLIHPGIAQVYDAGSMATPDGEQPFIAMELVDGIELNTYVKQGNLPLPELLELMIAICDAVQYAHQQGVMHRDLKPANILVTAAGQPKILDFGIARIKSDDLATISLRTEEGQILGTLPYMSPEQVRGEREAIDTRSDVYALGVILYELLVGQLPHDLSGKAITEAVRLITEATPSSLASIDSRLAGDLDNIVAMAMASEKSRRYATASDLAADLRRHLKHEPVSARPPSTIYLLRRFARRNRLLVGAAVVVFVTLSAGIVSTWTQLTRALDAEESEKEVSAQLRIEKAAVESEARKANGAQLFLKTVVLQANPYSRPGHEPTIREALMEVADSVETTLYDEPEVAVTVELAVADSLVGLGDPRQAEQHLQKALKIMESIDKGMEVEHVRANALYGEIMIQLGQIDKAIEYASQASKLIEQHQIKNVKLQASALRTLGAALYRSGKVEESRDELLKAKKLLQDTGDGPLAEFDRLDHLGDVQNQLGAAYAQIGDIKNADAHYAAAVGSMTARWGSEYQGIAIVLLQQSNLWHQAGDEKRVGELLDQAEQIFLVTTGEDGMVYTHFLEALCLHQSSIKNFSAAIETGKKCVEIRSRILGENHYLVGMSNHKLGIAQCGDGDHIGAQSSLIDAIAACAATAGKASIYHTLCQREYAGCLIHTNEFEAALTTLGLALENTLQSYPEESPAVADIHWRRGKALQAAERLPEAIQAYLKATSLLEAVYGVEHAQFQKCAGDLARVYSSSGQPHEAAAWVERSGGSSD
jgi:eukaryotic-like serine/threonine-protein kinase